MLYRRQNIDYNPKFALEITIGNDKNQDEFISRISIEDVIKSIFYLVTIPSI